MAILQKSALLAYLQNPSKRYRVALFFGPDRGLVAERAKTLFKQLQALYGIGQDDPFSTVLLSGEELASDPQKLLNEAYTMPLFGEGARLIHVKGYGVRTLGEQIMPLLQEAPDQTSIVIEAGDLKKGVGLRKAAEASPHTLAVACYADDARSLDGLLSEALKNAGLTISAEARQYLISHLGADRLTSRSEVDKLCLYAAEKGAINLADVMALIGDSAILTADALYDAAALGQRQALIEGLSRLDAGALAAAQAGAQILRHFQALHKARALADKGLTAREAVERLRPPVFFMRKEAVRRQLELWSMAKIDRALALLSDMMLQTRLQPSLASALLGDALMRIALNASR